MKFNDLLLPRNNSFVVIEDYASFVLLGQRGVDSSCFRTPGVAIDVYRLRILMRQTVDGLGKCRVGEGNKEDKNTMSGIETVRLCDKTRNCII